MSPVRRSEIAAEHASCSRRSFVRGLAAAAVGSAVLGACGLRRGPTTEESTAGTGTAVGNAQRGVPTDSAVAANATASAVPYAGAATDELGSPLTSYESATTYNNFYEFSTDKEAVARLAAGFVTSPWVVQVGGLVASPRTYDVDELRRRFGEEERVYRLRCVEGWSMVMPWLGFPLRKLLDDVQPTSRAQFVRFESMLDPERMPGVARISLDWPYVEALRLDEAMHDLTILATGLYGKPLPPQNGAPIRLVVPWKYGYKSIKSIVRIDLTEDMPRTTWPTMAPNEYDFYANVNPEVDHPRWSQATERRIGELRRRRTLPLNGYDGQVASLYADGTGTGRPRNVR